ncbi:MAG: hypothetical protein WA090_09375 [Candidatus Nanopelagicaceae bacterium]
MRAVLPCPTDPTWCDSDTGHLREGDSDTEHTLHFKHFGDPKGVNVAVWISVGPNGEISAKGFDFDIETATDPEDLEEFAQWCLDAAVFGREMFGALVTV